MPAVLVGTTLQAAQDDPPLQIVPRTNSESARVGVVTIPTRQFSEPEPYESFPGGAATLMRRDGDDVYSQPSANMDFEQELDFFLGNGLFKKIWVSSPSSTKASDGLGPLYNSRACERCHVRDGRGQPGSDGMVMRVSKGRDPHPSYGGQIQHLGLAGQVVEAKVTITYTETNIALSGGETATLRAPTYGLSDLGYGPLGEGALLSPRVAPQMIGLGLLEAIPAETILSRADPDDADGNGISGRANVVTSLETGQPMLGRFGYKAGQPTLRQQSADAAAHDIGLSTPLIRKPWGDCTEAQTTCREGPHGDGDARGDEIDDEALQTLTFYTRNLAVPTRANPDDPTVLAGKQVFYDTGCIACHTPKHVTHRLDGQPEQSFQLIWPYSDLLLHDMGEGLADNRPEALATGREWRTAPLWGIGLNAQVAGTATFLHDGRARSILEAILWHGGEAQPHRDAVITMDPVDRAALMTFLESL